MPSKTPVINTDSAPDTVSSLLPSTISNNSNRSGTRKGPQKLKDPLSDRQKPPRKKSVKITPLSSYDSHTSSGSVTLPHLRSSTLNNAESQRFRQCIEQEHAALEASESGHCYYIKDRQTSLHAQQSLEKEKDGTFFVRPALDDELNSNVEYFLDFVCHKQVIEVPICCDKEHRAFWFRSDYGHGSEVKRQYAGIDVLIQHKQENNFHELQYPFRICLYRPYRSAEFTTAPCTPLPDEVRAIGGRYTILHELATRGLTFYLNELMRIAKNDYDQLRDQCLVIANKLNGRNKDGQTPLILAIQSLKYEFVELLLDNNADVNMVDTKGCSPLHYACRQANSRILKKLIARHADPYYVNPRETTDNTYQSNLSAFHYLAMADEATATNIKRCARFLLECGCPLMPLTNEGKTPFDLAQMYNNQAYESLKIWCGRHEFNYLSPIEVSSRADAKTTLSDLACPNMLGKIRLRLKQYDNRVFVGSDGLFLLYKAKKTRSEPNGEYGLCVHHGGQVSVYPISQKHERHMDNPSKPSSKLVYKYALTADMPREDQTQVVLFRSFEELIYNHSKYKGILPTKLKDFVQKENGETITRNAKELLLPNNQLSAITDDEDEPETKDHVSGGGDDDDDDFPTDINITLINSIDLSQIYSSTLLNENHRRLIWLAKVRSDQTGSFSVIIKDYLPKKDLESYKQYRSNEFNPDSRYRNNEDEFPFEFSSRTHREYKHESELLLKEFRNHPLIVHTFICDDHLARDFRIFMEYLPYGNLNSYLTQLESSSLDPLIHAFHWIYQIAQVMGYLSTKKIVHRDLATRNILLKNEQYIKLSDFGLSRREGNIPKDKDYILPPRWTAPECFDRNQKISSLSDVWSFGVVIWEIFSFGSVPYDKEFKSDKLQLVSFLKSFLNDLNRRLSRPDKCSESIYDLMCRCWNVDMDKRPRFVDIINDLNGTGTIKDRIIPFSRDEKKSWNKAREEYLAISRSTRSMPANGDEYATVVDAENDDNDNDITKL